MIHLNKNNTIFISLTDNDSALQSSTADIPEPLSRCASKLAQALLGDANEILNPMMLQTILALTTMMEIRDPYTSLHQERVASLAVAIATELEASKKQLDIIYMAAIVHDIGKFGIPAEILCKPGKLDEIEYSLMKTHSQSGFEILTKINFPKPVAQIVLQHHERLNGSGYPLGLYGNEILWESKILGVADVVEAMASHRPYRPALGIQAALKEIFQHRGTQYEPAVVDACIQVIQNKGFYFNT